MSFRVIHDDNYQPEVELYVCATCGQPVFWDGVFEGKWMSYSAEGSVIHKH